MNNKSGGEKVPNKVGNGSFVVVKYGYKSRRSLTLKPNMRQNTAMKIVYWIKLSKFVVGIQNAVSVIDEVHGGLDLIR